MDGRRALQYDQGGTDWLYAAFGRELGPYGITVNALAPGRIDTPLMHMVPEEIQSESARTNSSGTLRLPEDVASAALFLTSAEAGFITGQVLDVAGGWFMT